MTKGLLIAGLQTVEEAKRTDSKQVLVSPDARSIHSQNTMFIGQLQLQNNSYRSAIDNLNFGRQKTKKTNAKNSFESGDNEFNPRNNLQGADVDFNDFEQEE